MGVVCHLSAWHEQSGMSLAEPAPCDPCVTTPLHFVSGNTHTICRLHFPKVKLSTLNPNQSLHFPTEVLTLQAVLLSMRSASSLQTAT